MSLALPKELPEAASNANAEHAKVPVSAPPPTAGPPEAPSAGGPPESLPAASLPEASAHASETGKGSGAAFTGTLPSIDLLVQNIASVGTNPPAIYGPETAPPVQGSLPDALTLPHPH